MSIMNKIDSITRKLDNVSVVLDRLIKRVETVEETIKLIEVLNGEIALLKNNITKNCEIDLIKYKLSQLEKLTQVFIDMFDNNTNIGELLHDKIVLKNIRSRFGKESMMEESGTDKNNVAETNKNTDVNETTETNRKVKKRKVNESENHTAREVNTNGN